MSLFSIKQTVNQQVCHGQIYTFDANSNTNL